MPAHPAMLFPVLVMIDDEHAVLADPFAVSLHSVTCNSPPPAAGRWCGERARSAPAPSPPRGPFIPTSRWASSPGSTPRPTSPPGWGPMRCSARAARSSWSRRWRRGPGRVVPDDGRARRRADATFGGIDVAYDTVGKPETFEVEVRAWARGTPVKSGVHPPGRWEWSLLYFKEIDLVGSNAFGIEVVDGVRRHGIQHYLDLAAAGRIDLTGLLTHTFGLSAWRERLRRPRRPGRQPRGQGRPRPRPVTRWRRRPTHPSPSCAPCPWSCDRSPSVQLRRARVGGAPA